MEGQIVLPGEVISETVEGLMPGLGVVVRDRKIISTVRGTINQVNQYISVLPITTIYSPNVGDIVVGRVSQVQKQRWKVQINCPISADLRLSSIFLPDEQFRRRTTADERNMRQYFDVGDLICAEVQKVFDSHINLHTRQQLPKRLDNGILINVPSRLITRVQSHLGELKVDQFSFNTIFGLNGSIWISPQDETGNIIIPRIRNCIILLATYDQPISLDSVRNIYEQTVNIPVNQIVSSETVAFLNNFK